MLIYGDPLEILSVVKTFITSSLDAFSSQKDDRDHRIDIQLELINDSVFINYKDNGPEIPQEVLSNLFKPVDSAKLKKLEPNPAMTISKQIIHSHKGTLSVTS